ncbi:hypothetical protein EEB13_05635 [Rhodococcus sp. WS3]|uniref:hypothetical protein n=1 Tax=Rhodococcus sp. WS3 TaxID=2486271 RepID=UPI001141DFC0|nr:hypothetical protein [Rhodococcus sp. WS3]ROZ49403.1 hypothetical protein EEB13_05635 [Rhodococcus sp. WS3]
MARRTRKNPALTVVDGADSFYTKTAADQRYAATGGVASARLALPRTVAITPFASPPSHPLIAGSASALTTANSRTYRYASGAFRLVGTRSTFEDGNGAVYSKQTGCSSNYETIMWGPEFLAIGGDPTNQFVEVGISIVPGGSAVRIWIEEDGKPYTATPEELTTLADGSTAVTSATAMVVQLPVPVNSMKTLRVLTSRARINYIRVPTRSVIQPATMDRFKIAVFGASFVAADYSWVQTMGRLSGAEVFQCGQAGTGFNEPGVAALPTNDPNYDASSDGGVYNSALRKAGFIATQANVGIIEDSGNDRGLVTDATSYAALVAARKAFLTDINAAAPNMPLIVTGIPPRGYTESISNSSAWCLAAMRQAINELPNLPIIGYHDYLGTIVNTPTYTTGANYAVGDRVISGGAIWECTVSVTGAASTMNTAFWKMFGWYTGTGRVGAPVGNGTRDVLMGAGVDGTHPTSELGYPTQANVTWVDFQADITRNTRVGTLSRAAFVAA